MDGLLLIDKPTGWTSFDVVNYVRAIAARAQDKKPRQVKVGHTGTLDPMATGLLVLCVGTYTKKVPQLIVHDKTYEAEMTFGMTSDTGDAEGTLKLYSTDAQQQKKSKPPTKKQLTEAVEQFVGTISQTPPRYSALKINGKRAYQLAREGKDVALEPRTVVVYSIEILSYEWPKCRVRCAVGSGTYIRSLAEDIGVALGVGAYLSELRRTAVDTWQVADAVGPKSISIDNIRDRLLA